MRDLLTIGHGVVRDGSSPRIRHIRAGFGTSHSECILKTQVEETGEILRQKTHTNTLQQVPTPSPEIEEKAISKFVMMEID